MSFAGWFRTIEDGRDQAVVSIGDSAGTHFLSLSARMSAAGDPVIAHLFCPEGNFRAATTTGITTNTWHHGVAVFAAWDDRRAYIDGGSKGTDAGSSAGITLDNTHISITADSTPVGNMNGDVAEVAIWKSILTDLDAWLLFMGVPPWEIQPANLVGLWLPYGDRTDSDYSGYNHHMTANNDPLFNDDPQKICPAWRFNPQYIGRRIVGREQPGGVWVRPAGGLPRVPRHPAAYFDGPTIF